MSATLGDVTRFEADLTRRTGRPTATITSTERPVPLAFEYAVTPIHDQLVRHHHAGLGIAPGWRLLA